MGLMTPKQFAAEVNIDERTVRRLANDGKLPGAYRIGGQWRIDYDEWKRRQGEKEQSPQPTR